MDEQTFCYMHPGRPTNLRCNRCGRPICTQCAVRTPVGYRCKTCVHEQQKVFETALWYDFPVAFVVAGVICGAASLLSSLVGIFVILVAFLAGSLAARAVQAAVRYRRSRYLWLAAAAGAVVGCLPILLWAGLMFLLSASSGGGGAVVGSLFVFVWPLANLVIAVGSLIAGIRGIRL